MDPPNNDDGVHPAALAIRAARARGFDDDAYCNEDDFRVAIRAAIAMEDDDDAHNNDDAVVDNDDENDDDDDDAELLLAVNNFYQNVDDDHAEEEEEEEGEEEAAAEEEEEEDVIYEPAEGTRICEEAMFILQHRLNFPAGQRDKSIVRFAQQFINNVQDDIHNTFTDIRKIDEGYDGLDSERDTEEEVETAIRCCPENLTRRDDTFRLLPIHCLTTMQSNDDVTTVCNAKAVSFIPLFARLAIEFNSFEEQERGGVLIEDGCGQNILQNLVYSSEESYVEEQVDTTFLAVLIQLRQSGWFVKDDIQQNDLMHRLCQSPFFSRKRFRFIKEWDPSSLLQMYNHINIGYLPLHLVILKLSAGDLLTRRIKEFEIVFDAMVRFFPKWKGLHALFQKEGGGRTAFELACETLTRKTVIEVVEAILVRYSGTTNIGNALMMAAIDDNVNLDGLYFLMRRHPATMLSMVRRDHSQESTTTTISSVSNSKSNNRNGDIHSIDNSNESTDDTGTDDDNINTNINTDTDTNNTIAIASNTCSDDSNAIVIRRSTRKRKRN